jgi:hypothetical protein
MILKASQRGGGQDLAQHLTRLDDNEHMELAELRGFAADDLRGAFKEAEAISRGTKCRQYLFSLSLSPPPEANVSEEVFRSTIDGIEQRLGLEGQPRAIVFHEKEGRRHAHCVWSRIDAETMTARTLPYFKNKLMAASRELYLEHGWTLPRGLETPSERNPTNFTLAEWQQAKRQGIDPRWIKQTVQGCWSASDNRKAFERSLEEKALFLARGDRRGFVVLDHGGEVYALPRLLDVKTKDVRARLGDGDDLRSVDETKKTIGQRMTPAIRRHVEEARDRFRDRSAKLGAAKEAMTQAHRKARSELQARQSQDWQRETKERADRLPKGWRGLWQRLTGRYQEIRSQNEAEAARTQLRQAQERQGLAERQLDQRRTLQAEFKALRGQQAAQLNDLRADIGRYLRLTRGQEPARARERSASLGLRLSP